MTVPKIGALRKTARKVFESIKDYRAKHDHGPTYEDIAADVGLKAKSNAKHHVDRLIEKGYVTRDDGKPRSINIAKIFRNAREGFVDVPVFDHIGAALDFVLPDGSSGVLPTRGVDEVLDAYSGEDEFHPDLDWRPFPEWIVGSNDRVFALETRGDSMADANVDEGDYVLFQAAIDAERGALVAARIGRDGEFTTTLKRYHPPTSEGEMVRLQPENPAYEAIKVHVKDCEIQGKAIGVLRQY